LLSGKERIMCLCHFIPEKSYDMLPEGSMAHSVVFSVQGRFFFREFLIGVVHSVSGKRVGTAHFVDKLDIIVILLFTYKLRYDIIA